MDINTILTTLRDAIADDSATKTWTQSIYEADHTLFVGIDSRNPPGEADCPYVAIYHDSRGTGTGNAKKECNITVVCAIHDASLVTGGKKNVTEYAGVRRLEKFRQLIEAVVDAADLGGRASVEAAAAEYEEIEHFPFFMCATLYSVTEALLIGASTII
jgi:hypothetical protein